MADFLPVLHGVGALAGGAPIYHLLLGVSTPEEAPPLVTLPVALVVARAVNILP